MKLSKIRAELLAQHEELRRLIDLLRILAGRIQLGDPLDLAMQEGLTRLGVALAAHNSREEELLRDLIPTVDAWGPVRAAFMDEAHCSEHDALEETLLALSKGPIRFLDLIALFERLLEHMAEEEITVLGGDVLRDDAVVISASS
jgi:hypothetical protein